MDSFEKSKIIAVRSIEAFVRIEKVLSDQAYRGPLGKALEKVHHCEVEITEKLGEGFIVAPWRWVVERTFSWLEKARRLGRDYEVLPENHESNVYIVMIRLISTGFNSPPLGATKLEDGSAIRRKNSVMPRCL